MSASIDFVSNFQPNQIVCLEFGDRCLYAEVIQVVSVRGLCWVRPLMLVELTSEGDSISDGKHILCDLRGGSDLLWPLSLFRAAMDTEAIAFLTQLQLLESEDKDAAIAHRQLRDFVGQVWEALPSAFF